MNIPEPKALKLVSFSQEVFAFFAGPLPPPQILDGYERIMPGLADRIVSMAESSLAHNLDQQKEKLHVEISERKHGQFGAIAITLAALGFSAWITVYGNAIVGGLLGGATLIGIVTVLIGGREYLMARLNRDKTPHRDQASPRPRKKKR